MAELELKTENEGQKRAATDRITKLVREIDSCLSLMKKMN